MSTDRSNLKIQFEPDSKIINVISYIAIPSIHGEDISIDLSLLGVIYWDSAPFDAGRSLSPIDFSDRNQQISLKMDYSQYKSVTVFLSDGFSRKLIYPSK